MSDYTPHRINAKMMLVDENNGWKLLAIDDVKSGDMAMRAKFAALNASSITAVNALSFRKGAEDLFRSDVPVNIYLKDGRLCVDAQAAGKLKLYGIAQEFSFEKGANRYDGVNIKLPIDRDSLIKLSENADMKNEKDIFEGVKKLNVQWSCAPTGFEYNSLTDMFCFDINKDGRREIIAACNTGDAFVYGTDGKLLWRLNEQSGVYSVTAADINRDGSVELFFGTGRHTVIVTDAAGAKINEFAVPLESSGRYGTRSADPQHITVLKVYDIDKDGDMELIVGTRTWQVQIFDHNYNQQWFFTYNYHGVEEILFEDMDNDGVTDIVTSDRYGTVRVLDWKSKDFATSIKGYTATGDTSVAVTDFDKDGKKEFINASSAGTLSSFTRPEKISIVIKDAWDPYYGYNEVWSFDNYGYSYYDVDVLTDAQGNESVLAASETGYIYSLNATDGSLNWSRYLGSVVHTISAYGSKYIIAGTEKGDVVVLDAAGVILQRCNLGGKISGITGIDNATFAVADTYGNISVVNW